MPKDLQKRLANDLGKSKGEGNSGNEFGNGERDNNNY